MKQHWLQKAGTEALILVFGGWGLGSKVFETLNGNDDILFVEDYRQLDFDPAVTASYSRVSLLAYSFGVVSALHWLAQTNWQPDRLVAVNGTAHPVSHDKGIAPEIIAATADGLSPASFAKFVRRCGWYGSVPLIDISTTQAELLGIAERGTAPERPFDRVWISQKDQIIPPQVQETAWAGQHDVIRYSPGPHQPFEYGQSWSMWLS